MVLQKLQDHRRQMVFNDTSLQTSGSKCLRLEVSKTIQVYSIIRAKSLQYEGYDIVNCQPATGLVYLINNFLSGHVRVRGRPNGQYPYNYKEMIDSVFGPSNNAIEVCSNSIESNSNLTTVDIRPDTKPQYVADGQDMKALFQDGTFDR